MKISFQITTEASSLDTVQLRRDSCSQPAERWRSVLWGKTHRDFNLQDWRVRSRDELTTAGGQEPQSWPLKLIGIVTKTNKLCKGKLSLPLLCVSGNVMVSFAVRRVGQKCSLCYDLPAVNVTGSDQVPICQIFKLRQTSHSYTRERSIKFYLGVFS